MDPQDFIARQMGQMQVPGGMDTLRPTSDLMQLLRILAARHAKGASAPDEVTDRVFGTYGYDPDIEEKQGYATGLPPVGCGALSASSAGKGLWYG